MDDIVAFKAEIEDFLKLNCLEYDSKFSLEPVSSKDNNLKFFVRLAHIGANESEKTFLSWSKYSKAAIFCRNLSEKYRNL